MKSQSSNKQERLNYIGKYISTGKRVKKITSILFSIFQNPIVLVSTLISRYPIRLIIPDHVYLKILYRGYTGLKLNFNNPTRFNEKMQCKKLAEKTVGYAGFVDKYEVRKYVTERIGEKYLIPLINIYDRVEDIDFEKLPNQFVLKCTHDSGSTIICRDKATLDKIKTRKTLQKRLKNNYFYKHRESQYKNIKARIVCEVFIALENDKIPPDLKLFCFAGVPKFIQVDLNRYLNHERLIYDTNWAKAPFNIKYPVCEKELEKPTNLNELIEIASNLSQGFPFVRVDLYLVKGRIYFGELTFTHESGFAPFFPDEYDLKLGDMINLQT